MKQIDEYFTPTKLSELRTTAQQPRATWYDYEPQRAQQELEVYEKREALAKLSEMIEELKGIYDKVEAIQQFAKDNDLESMVSFCCWGSPEWEISGMLDSDVESDAIRWMSSNHDC